LTEDTICESPSLCHTFTLERSTEDCLKETSRHGQDSPLKLSSLTPSLSVRAHANKPNRLEPIQLLQDEAKHMCFRFCARHTMRQTLHA
jgi:hypothetical protein